MKFNLISAFQKENSHLFVVTEELNHLKLAMMVQWTLKDARETVLELYLVGTVQVVTGVTPPNALQYAEMGCESAMKIVMTGIGPMTRDVIQIVMEH